MNLNLPFCGTIMGIKLVEWHNMLNLLTMVTLNPVAHYISDIIHIRVYPHTDSMGILHKKRWTLTNMGIKPEHPTVKQHWLLLGLPYGINIFKGFAKTNSSDIILQVIASKDISKNIDLNINNIYATEGFVSNRAFTVKEKGKYTNVNLIRKVKIEM
ncbi:hypothetical protein ACJX0J_007014 [Zea mays]